SVPTTWLARQSQATAQRERAAGGWHESSQVCAAGLLMGCQHLNAREQLPAWWQTPEATLAIPPWTSTVPQGPHDSRSGLLRCQDRGVLSCRHSIDLYPAAEGRIVTKDNDSTRCPLQ